MNVKNKWVLLASSRPFSWVNTAFPFVAGWLMTQTPLDWRFYVGTFFFLFPYNLAMYGINDIFDYESDIHNPRKASVEGAVVPRAYFVRMWVWITIWTVPLSIALFWGGDGWSRALLLFSLFMVVAYSAPPYRFKEKPFLDSFTSSCHFVTPFIYSLLLADGWSATLWPVGVAYGLWGVASHAFGAVQDITYDKQAGIGSVATVIGARATVFLSTACYCVAAILVAITYWSTSGVIAALLIVVYAANTLRFHAVTEEGASKTNAGWRVFMALNPGFGAYLTGLYLVSRGVVPFWGALVIAVATYATVAFLLKQKPR